MQCECGAEFEVPVILAKIIKRCPACQERADAEAERAEAEAATRDHQDRLAHARADYPRLALAAGIPPRLHAADFKTTVRDADNGDALDNANALLKSETGGILYLTGEAGTGKTWIAAAICRERILALQPVRFVRSNDLLNSIRAGFRGDGPSDPFKDFPFLVIDDLGAECFTEWSVGYWYDLIDYRYNYLLPTVITSNLPLKDLKTKVSARVVSRIAESSMVVKLTGKDRRTAKGAKP
jgi:DNA replication protein DnaC